MKLSAIIATFVCLVSIAPRLAAEDAQERWYVVRISGSPVGFASEVVRTEPDATHYRTHMDVTLSRMGTRMGMFLSAEETDDPDGRLRDVSMTIKASTMAMSVHGVREGDDVVLTVESPGYTNTRRIPWEEGALGMGASDRYVTEQVRAGNREFEFRSFDPQTGEFKTMRVRRIDADPEEVDGEMQNVTAIEEFEGDAETPTSTTWFDESFQPVRTVFLQLGLKIVLERVTPEEMSSLELEPSFDIIRESMIPCKGYPGPPEGVHDVTLRLHFARAGTGKRDFDGPNQKVVSRGDGWIDLLVSRDVVNELPLDADRDVYLKPDRYIQSENPEIAAVADSIRAATGKDGWELASEIAAWVGGYITQKNFEKGFASALEVLHSRAGDCTEHSMLLTAVLRAAGIPARPTVGLAYSNGQFIGHMWTEVFIGEWRTLDALDLNTDPIRIRIATSRDGRAVDEKDLVQAYGVVGGLEVEVVDYHLQDKE